MSLFHTDKGGFLLDAQFERDTSTGLDVRNEAGQRIPHVNQGALFGFLREHKTLANGGFALISLLAAAAIIFWSTHKNTARDPWLCCALGLILAGTLGNFYDRVVFNGVRDFLHWNYLFDWPVFNVADCCLVCGAFLLLIQAFATQAAPSEPGTGSARDRRTVASVPSSRVERRAEGLIVERRACRSGRCKRRRSRRRCGFGARILLTPCLPLSLLEERKQPD